MFTPFEPRRFTASEVVEIMSPENRWFASEALGREATTEELIRHYTKHSTPYQFLLFEIDD